jgi:hypothetical protein
METKNFLTMLIAFCLLATLFLALPTLSNPAAVQYDPWADINDDGVINMYDIAYSAQRFMTSGEPINKTALLLELQTKIESLNASVVDLQSRVDTLENPVLQNFTIWSGGSSTRGTAEGWNKYRTDIVEFNTAQDYLSVSPEGTVTVLTAGYYRIHAYTLMYGPNDGMVHLVVNGAAVQFSTDKRGVAQWFPMGLDVIRPLNAGDGFYVLYGNPGQYAYYEFDSTGSSRLQVSYEGPL